MSETLKKAMKYCEDIKMIDTRKKVNCYLLTDKIMIELWEERVNI